MDFLALPLAAILLVLAANVLAILLRVTCHFCGVEIPTYGRALFTVVATTGLGIVVAIGLQDWLVGWDPLEVSLAAQLILVALDLAAFAVMSSALYVPLLRARPRQAFHVWLAQAAVFVGFGALFGSCLGAMSLL